MSEAERLALQSIVEDLAKQRRKLDDACGELIKRHLEP